MSNTRKRSNQTLMQLINMRREVRNRGTKVFLSGEFNWLCVHLRFVEQRVYSYYYGKAIDLLVSTEDKMAIRDSNNEEVGSRKRHKKTKLGEKSDVTSLVDRFNRADRKATVVAVVRSELVGGMWRTPDMTDSDSRDEKWKLSELVMLTPDEQQELLTGELREEICVLIAAERQAWMSEPLSNPISLDFEQGDEDELSNQDQVVIIPDHNPSSSSDDDDNLIDEILSDELKIESFPEEQALDGETERKLDLLISGSKNGELADRDREKKFSNTSSTEQLKPRKAKGGRGDTAGSARKKN